ncbi:MAG TPA: S8 family serine peptidase [Candidatus Saccharimonadales bacterium]|nr:S8 family serine peptidase [Candidatus Saccharimonadales bacterium]
MKCVPPHTVKALALRLLGVLLTAFAVPLSISAQSLDAIGVTALRNAVPSMLGTGVTVGQVEAGDPSWEVNPTASGVQQPLILFNWASAAGTSISFPNGAGFESGHADTVASRFYGLPNGVAPGVAKVLNYEANYFYTNVIGGSIKIPAAIVNQSYVLSASLPNTDSYFDNYAAKYGVLFVNGAGNGGPVFSPATSFNCIAVGVYGASSSTGPTSDGRCKPDITAPDAYTSFSAPQVAGAAAVLLQAAQEGAGGGSLAATNTVLLKALLLNGAVKPADWTTSVALPLDSRYGTGILNLLNSYRQLRGGVQPRSSTSTALIGGSHLPPATTTNIPVRRGWDYGTIISSVSRDAFNHYFFDVTSGTRTSYVFTATLAWMKRDGASSVNNLDLYFYDASNNTLIASSQSLANNVEHIYVPSLPPGHYDLQVMKNGGSGNALETYGLAFDFGPIQSPVLTNSIVLNGRFNVKALAEPSQRVVLQGTTDYQSWTPLLTNTVGFQGSTTFTNAQTGNFRFYRACQQE